MDGFSIVMKTDSLGKDKLDGFCGSCSLTN